LRKAAIAFLAIVLAGCSAAEPDPFPYFEVEGGRVRDGADLLSPETESQLTKMLDEAEENYGQQLAVVTVESLHGYSIDDFSLQYANAWGVGHRDRNDGLMILVAPNERKVRIEVGLGIEDTFSNAFCQDVIDLHILPAFKAGELERGIVKGVGTLVDRMKLRPTIPANDNEAAWAKEAA
jgi:uncharacterized protein